MAGEDPAQIGQGRAEDVAGLAQALAQGAERTEPDHLDIRPRMAGFHAEITQTDRTAADRALDGVAFGPAGGRGRQIKAGCGALHAEADLLAGAQDHELGQVLEVADVVAVGVEDQVARLEPRVGGRRIGHNLAHPRRQADVAERPGQAGEDDDGEREVGEGSGGDHQGALPQGLEMEVATKGRGPFLRQHVLAQFGEIFLIGDAGGVLIAGELHVAADGDPAEPPFGAGLVVP